MAKNSNSTIAIIGAGPAGLSAACALSLHHVKTIIYEIGKCINDRDHISAVDLASGVGGAGLFSDGKFSFFPSGSQVYALRDHNRLKMSYEWMSSNLMAVGIDTQHFPNLPITPWNASQKIQLKDYPSVYGSLNQRRELICNLNEAIDAEFLTRVHAQQIRPVRTGYVIEGIDQDTGVPNERHVTSIILATGKMGALTLSEFGSIALPLKALRYEFGIRIEYPSTLGFLSKDQSPDVKYIWERDDIQCRTFCTCRDGEVWNIPYRGLTALSGRSDGPPTGYSNFGLLVRFKGNEFGKGQKIWEHLQANPLPIGHALYESMPRFMEVTTGSGYNAQQFVNRPWFPSDSFQPGRLGSWLGEHYYGILRTAAQDLLDRFPSLLDERTLCLFPVIEGIGYYPNLDNNLKVSGHNIWCAGDVCGSFRGLVPSLVSGYYVGLCAANSTTH